MAPTPAQIRAAKDEKWHRGDLSYKLHKAQKHIDATYKGVVNQLFVANCSRQFGKTYWACVKAVECALSKPNAQIRYGAAFQTDLKEFIIPAFEKIMEDAPAHLRGKYKAQTSCFEFENGSRIKLVGIDKRPEGLRGNTLDMVVLDECGFLQNLDYVYKSVIIPATTHRPNAKIILVSTPPSTPAHSFLDYCAKAESENAYRMFTIHDNPMIDERTIERLKMEAGGEESTTWKREYLCQFVTDSELQIIPEWKEENHCKEMPRDEYYQYYHRYVGMDLGTKDFTALVFGYYDFKKATLVIQDEMMMNGPSMNTLKLVSAIQATELTLWEGIKPFRRVSDNNNLHLLQDLSSLHSMHFTATSKDTLDAMVNEVRTMVASGRIIVEPKCKQLLGCLKYGVYNKKRSEFARSNVYGHYDHLAALIYLVRNLSLSSNPIPADHGYQNHTAWLGNVREDMKTTQTGRELAKALTPKLKRLKY